MITKQEANQNEDEYMEELEKEEQDRLEQMDPPSEGYEQ